MKVKTRKLASSFLVTFICLTFLVSDTAFAYIGPGAGFAFLGSTAVFLLTIVMALFTIAFWPLQWLWRKLFSKGISKKARTRRVVIIGLDGLEPKLVDKYIAAGKMPNMKKLSETGSFSRLGTTLPALSPVAWSSFQTGVNPGAHNIFDFLTRDKRHCLPRLSSTETNTITKVTNFLGIKFKHAKTEVSITRKSQPFWKILGKHGVFSNVIRVPISYPPEKFNGNVLSAMCTPDLKGTQGSFTSFTTRSKEASSQSGEATGGTIKRIAVKDGQIESSIDGPPNPDGSGFLQAPFTATINQSDQTVTVEINQHKEILKLNKFSPWLEIVFKYKGKEISGICRFCLREIAEDISIYVSPVNIHPEKPALPIAHPVYFSSWLAKKNGLYGTLGLMEDTWGRNEHALDDARFLDQTYLTHNEREKMLFETLDRTKEGVCICVFDASDRIQHMFWRYLDENHPSPKESNPAFENAIPTMYEKMDDLVGRIKTKISEDDVLIILSDHGFASFRRCINLNTWLYENGYLAIKGDKPSGGDYFQDVDWSRTKAFAVGLTGIYINKVGREANGIVEAGDAQKIKDEIAKKLEDLTDPKDRSPAIRKVYQASQEYRGLYTDEAPDLIIGYESGYRVSWDSITGTIEPEVFSDNIKAWSGDHHVDPRLVPGILFTNRKLKESNPDIVDIAPTVLDLFALKAPAYMEGKVIL